MSLAGPWRSHQEQSRLIASGVLADKPLCDELRLLKSGGILHGIALAIGQFRLKALEVALFVVLRNPRALHDAPRPLPHPAVARHGYLAVRLRDAGAGGARHGARADSEALRTVRLREL